jgi:hypothetical protein
MESNFEKTLKDLREESNEKLISLLLSLACKYSDESVKDEKLFKDLPSFSRTIGSAIGFITSLLQFNLITRREFCDACVSIIDFVNEEALMYTNEEKKKDDQK